MELDEDDVEEVEAVRTLEGGNGVASGEEGIVRDIERAKVEWVLDGNGALEGGVVLSVITLSGLFRRRR